MSLGGRTARVRNKKRGGGPGGPNVGEQRGGDLMGLYSDFRNSLADMIHNGANYARGWLPEPLKNLTKDSGVLTLMRGGVDQEGSGITMSGGRRRR
jgi:hypothetical protein